ncbi:amidase [Mesobacillus selenatarsenatis]|uniref:Aspartyl-tRNA(Asn) amidotransferase subunit A /glutamyl-tRNA(Gln) amidotransferase subunit A n=1 Tax=Mesobacillus selenatarsenatis (strain DSM 18680 / JCM 14380 / FERM P-15431 / SF-1) TaxID=1321606 RepID=A0A0A8X4Y4_MESS1|nr:amidase [Mesobacillus selenatarsenatis]GAM13206.1 aspartyl-tRNA(Asn) amidotransferase subunit A /glutamyl-tRNA(Gln) amidotransferase subunit A [Mesobacillus selenatarsenatis SF-1]
MMKKWSDLTILEVAELYRRKELSPVELVGSTFERLKEVDSKLNSFITVMESEAKEAAKEAEAAFLRNEVKHVLYGIPYSVKDLYYTQGVRTTCGSKILKGYIPDTTAPLVSRLKNCGAILIGKTNMLEFAYGIVHPEYGQTNNPWDLRKTAGGSSGGSAASVAAGIGLFSLGSDTGGSIRIPASYCGIAGLKPTYGLLSLEGIFPLSPSLDHVGPMAKSSEDLMVVMEALVRGFHFAKLPKNENVIIGILPADKFSDVNEEVARIYKEALEHVKKLEWTVEEIELKYFDFTEEIVMNVLLPEAASIHERWLSRKEEYAPLTYKQIEAGLVHRSLDYLKAKNELVSARKDVDGVLEDVDFLLMPTVPYPAPEEDPALEDDNEMKFTGLFNVTGHPAMTINAGFTKNNLPVGLQLVGRCLDDNRLIETAAKLEKLLGKSMKGIKVNV